MAATTMLDAHGTLSDPSDIIGAVGVERSEAAAFVGRESEAARLRALLGLDDGPQSALVLLSGDAGIGKTRLLAEVVAGARASGVTVLVGHCLGEAGQSLPYLPYVEVLRRLEAARPEAFARVLADHPGLRRLVPSQAPETMADRSDIL